MEAGRGERRREIARGVYFAEGKVVNPHIELLDDAGMVMRSEQGAALHPEVDEWHYQLLDSDGIVLGHGDGYFDEAHVVSALTGLLEDQDVPFAEGKPGKLRPEDAALGKRSETDLAPFGGDPAAARVAEMRLITGMQLGMLGMLQALLMAGLTWLLSISNYAENKLVDAVVNASTTGGGLPTADPYVKLHTGDPGEDGTNNAAGETTRKQVAFAASSGGTAASSADAAWTNVSTSETYAYVSMWDASSGGNCLGSGALTASKAVTAGDNFTIPSGSLSYAID